MRNKESKPISKLALSIAIISIIIAFLYKFNNTTQSFIQEQIPIVTNYSIDAVCLCIIILGLIIALIFRTQPERYSDSDDDDGDDSHHYSSPHNPPEPSYHSPDPQIQKTVSAEPIVQPIIIQPIIKQPIQQNDEPQEIQLRSNYDNEPHHHYNSNTNQNQLKRSSYYNSKHRKKPIVQNYWKPKSKKKKKFIIRNYWDPKSWNRR